MTLVQQADEGERFQSDAEHTELTFYWPSDEHLKPHGSISISCRAGIVVIVRRLISDLAKSEASTPPKVEWYLKHSLFVSDVGVATACSARGYARRSRLPHGVDRLARCNEVGSGCHGPWHGLQHSNLSDMPVRSVKRAIARTTSAVVPLFNYRRNDGVKLKWS